MSGRRSWVWGVVALACLWLLLSPPTQARLHPYYIVVGSNHGLTTPRILFVLDTSGSMAERGTGSARCRWYQCEEPAYYGTTEESRISAARRAIKSVVAATADGAKAALMTFDAADARTVAPPKCNDEGTPVRFAYVTHYGNTDGSGLGPIQRNWDTGLGAYYEGAYRVCGEGTRRPFVYLRWDELGVGSVITGDGETGPVPPSPLISHEQSDFTDPANKTRRAQWFPKYMGTRVRLDATTDPDQSIVLATVGDYDPLTEVWENDFYYWPYVDGFPGYHQWGAFASAAAAGYGDGNNRSGLVAEGPANGARLWAPFYLDLSATSIDPTLWGPADEATAQAEVEAYVSPMIEGGVDVSGSTPWASTIGTIPGTATESNAPGSHTSVASYLKFLSTADTPDVCAPTSVVLVTDGIPSPGEGGSVLYERLAALRNSLDTNVFVVGFGISGTEVNNMACAGAGACTGGSGCASPCDDTPADAWDTCRDPSNPTADCAFLASTTAELQAALTQIVGFAIDLQVSAGPGVTANEFGIGADGDIGEGSIVQTRLFSTTDYPEWRGHVTRDYCTETDGTGTLLPHCEQPVPEFELDESEPTFGPCPQSRSWDAGECLQLTTWNERRIYSYDANNDIYRITEDDGTASAKFVAELQALSLIPGSDPQAEADAIAAFILGRDAPGGWKLPGLANSAPIIAARIPRYEGGRAPEVFINDPHCSGRRFGDIDLGEIPKSLRDYAIAVWDADKSIDTDWYLNTPADHYAYQEAVLVGDDMGVLHAFQFNSGNELFGLLPRPLLGNAVQSAAIGPATMGQPEAIEDHIYGVASTVNQGWVYDDADAAWRHLVVFGFGPGGTEIVALDVQHMSPEHPKGQVEVLWTTEDPALKSDYDEVLGETWARPALSYHLSPDEMTSTPSAFLVFGSGYPSETPTTPEQGRVLVAANALTGAILEQAELPAPSGPVYESTYGSVVDPAIATHCLSRYWAEAQETYVADPAGRLFRWDLGRDGTPLTFKHDADSDPLTNAEWAATAVPITTFPACTGTGDTCTVDPSNKGDVFVYPPAVSASDRITDLSQANNAVIESNQFLIALASGSTNEDTLDWGKENNDFHSSLYLLVDDHSAPADAHDGFTIPAGAPKFGAAGAGTAVGADPKYVRIALSDIQRTRTVEPYPGATPTTETRNFNRKARPVKAPRIFVTGAAQAGATATDPVTIIEGVEVYFVTFTVYEPGEGECDPAFYDSANDTWYFDYGSTYEITFRLTSDTTSGFDFTGGATDGTADFGAGFEEGLVLESVNQLADDTTCPGGVCGPQPGAPSGTPCDENVSDSAVDFRQYAIPLTSRQLGAFSPVE